MTAGRRNALCGVMIALAMVLSYLESLVPVFVAIPGVKLGLANIVTIVALRKLGTREACVISLGRVMLSSLLFGNFVMLIYSLAGANLSIKVMIIVSKIKIFSITGVSICGAVAHNFGQIVVAFIMLENIHIFYYMAVLFIVGAISGALMGMMAGYIIKNVRFR